MKVTSAEFFTSAPDLPSCPASMMHEFALIGRSNVGKSSLLNMLTGRTDLAKVSGEPGKTRLINFFTINKKWSLVDLPGYGFAKVARDHQAKFNDAVGSYLAKRENLACIFVLIDSRLPPQGIDMEFIQWLMRMKAPFVIVFTKADKLNSPALEANIELFKQTLDEFCEGLPTFFLTSSKTAIGRKEILSFIGKAME